MIRFIPIVFVVSGALLGSALAVVPSATTVYERVPDISHASAGSGASFDKKEEQRAVERIATPDFVRAIYMTQCAATTSRFRNSLTALIKETELNAIIIDVKDYTGTIGFVPSDPTLRQEGASGCVVRDMRELVAHFTREGIYTIARLTVFQDPYYATRHPSLAVQKESDGSIWKDSKGLAFVDVGAREFWDYTARVAEETHALGFGEINFDYIRYPSDGPMADIAYPVSGPALSEYGYNARAHVVRDFFEYLHDRLAPQGVVTSADLFGMTTVAHHDLSIGQVLEFTFPYFDYVAPMTYPSHYPAGFYGIPNPNEDVYRVMKISLDSAVARATATTTRHRIARAASVSTSTPAVYVKEPYEPQKIRPWIQDFNYGGIYGPKEVGDQIRAVYDAGLTSWMVWDPANRYEGLRGFLRDE